MRTIKRNLPNLTNSSIKNYNKYFNQLTFDGIVHGQDIYNLNQHSFADTKNVYISNGSLASRPPLQKDESLPEWVIPRGHTIVEIVTFEDISIYVTSYTQIVLGLDVGTYYRIAISPTNILDGIKKYKIANIDRYIICFNNLGAKVFDINNQDDGWVDLVNFVDIPVTKRVVGNLETILPGNEFTKSYKEQYIWSNNSHPILPEGNADIEVDPNNKSYKLTLTNPNIYPEYRLMRQLTRKLTTGGIFSAAKGIVCIGYDDWVYVSYDNGVNWTKIIYPAHESFIGVASISEDGQYYFFASAEGVYRCNLSDTTWTIISTGLRDGAQWFIPKDAIGLPYYWQFLTGDIFIFVVAQDKSELDSELESSSNKYAWSLMAYCYGPGLVGNYDLDTREEGTLRRWSLSLRGLNSSTEEPNFHLFTYQGRVNIGYDNSDGLCTAAICYDYYSNGKSRELISWSIPYGKLSCITRAIKSDALYDTNTSDNITSVNKTIKIISNNRSGLSSVGVTAINDGLNIRLLQFVLDNSGETVRTYYQDVIYHFFYYLSVANVGNRLLRIVDTITFDPSLDGLDPIELSEAWIIGNSLFNKDGSAPFTDKDNYNACRLPIELGSAIKGCNYVINDTIYAIRDEAIWTNSLSDNDIITFTYTYLDDDDHFYDVPNITYSDTELYLALGNTLRITKNTYKDNNILFNLPKINDQSFISQITGMLNISSTEVAIFFKNKVVICSKVEDETYGIRYDYYNSRLSVGIRPGDSIINTLEGQYTVIPTSRGLAFMSYQEFMATTDQTLSYISDDIRDIWDDFYKASKTIKILQWRDYLLLTNSTNQILLLYINESKLTWWVWEVPIVIKSMSTDQIDLKLIADNLYVFKDDERYWDFPKTAKQTRINWSILSQPLHMNAPNYYKSIKQLIFQFIETTKNRATITAQVKLYRKRLTVRDPEVIAFKIDEFSTFVKRFNYWKVNEVQWGLSDDPETVTPAQLKLNGISVKYEFGDEVK